MYECELCVIWEVCLYAVCGLCMCVVYSVCCLSVTKGLESWDKVFCGVAKGRNLDSSLGVSYAKERFVPKLSKT